MSNGINLITANGSNELTRGFRVHPETGLLVFVGSSELHDNFDPTTANNAYTMSGQSIDGEPDLQGPASLGAPLHTGVFTNLDFGDFLNADDAEFQKVFQRVGGPSPALSIASDSSQHTQIGHNMPIGHQNIEAGLVTEPTIVALVEDDGAIQSDNLASTTSPVSLGSSTDIDQIPNDSSPAPFPNDTPIISADTTPLSTSQPASEDSVVASHTVDGLSKAVHTFDDLPGGAVEFLYAPRRNVSPGDIDSLHENYTKDKALWVGRLKEAFVTIEDLPPRSEWGINESTKSLMNSKFEADVKARIGAGDLDKRVSAICDFLFTSFIKLYTTGDHFDSNAMPHKSDSSTMDDYWDPDQRMSLYLHGLSESKTLAGNLLSGLDAIAVYAAKPQGRRNAIYGSAKSNAIKAAKLKGLQVTEASSGSATVTVPPTAIAGPMAVTTGATVASNQAAQIGGPSAVAQLPVQPPATVKGRKSSTKGSSKKGKKRGPYITKAMRAKAAMNANNALGHDTMPGAEASRDASSLDQWNILQPADFQPSKKRPASSQDSSIGGADNVERSKKSSRKEK